MKLRLIDRATLRDVDEAEVLMMLRLPIYLARALLVEAARAGVREDDVTRIALLAHLGPERADLSRATKEAGSHPPPDELIDLLLEQRPRLPLGLWVMMTQEQRARVPVGQRPEELEAFNYHPRLET